MALPSLLTGGKALWTLIDEYLFDLASSWKDQYLETALATVVVAEQFNPDGVTYPLILISSYERTVGNDEAKIGSGEWELAGVRYPYDIVIIAAFDTYETAKEFAAKAAASFTDALRADPTLGAIQGFNGEYVVQFEFDDTELFVRGLAAQDPGGNYTGTAVVRIDVHSET